MTSYITRRVESRSKLTNREERVFRTFPGRTTTTAVKIHINVPHTTHIMSWRSSEQDTWDRVVFRCIKYRLSLHISIWVTFVTSAPCSLARAARLAFSSRDEWMAIRQIQGKITLKQTGWEAEKVAYLSVDTIQEMTTSISQSRRGKLQCSTPTNHVNWGRRLGLEEGQDARHFPLVIHLQNNLPPLEVTRWV